MKKRIVFITHSYHKKTKSVDFFKKILEKEFELIVFFDESWQGKPYIDFKKINKLDPSQVIFLQQIPNLEFLKDLKCKNIIFIPMYDNDAGKGVDYWRSFSSFNPKVICFAKKLYDRVKQAGLESYYIQYFLKPSEEKIDDHKGTSIFFWQRINSINWNTVKKLIGSNRIKKVYFKKNIDPNNKLIIPDEEDIKKYNIQLFEGWLSTEDYLKKLRECNVFIAPRTREGIGMAYLEAMANGLCVVAHDDATANEYIESGKNGILFNANNPKEINLNNVDEIGKNAHLYIKEGYDNWLRDREKIMDLLRKI
ncbi:glycosyltransferase [Candidatus Woesearchaeota archaeon]|nr:glycosyltransferase [Candidatus Woesearchaeota archaeon]